MGRVEWRTDGAARAAIILYAAMQRISDAVREAGGQLEIADIALRDARSEWPAIQHELRSAESAMRGKKAARGNGGADGEGL